MERSKKALRKIVVLAIGVPVLILGIILLVLPGPGLLVILIGLVILAQEFTWADKHVHRVKKHVKRVSGGVEKKYKQ